MEVFSCKVKNILVLVVLTLTACSSHQLFLFYMEPYTWEILSSQGIGRQELKSILKSYGYRTELVIAQPDIDSEVRLKEIIRTEKPQRVFMSLFFPFNVSNIAPQFPEISFVQEEQLLETHELINVTQISFERKQAFYQAGLIVGRLIIKENELEKVGVLSSVLNETTRQEIAEFQKGFETSADPSHIVYKEIGNLTDRVKTRRMLEKMKEDGVVITLFKTYTLTGFCLDFLQKEGGVAVIEDWWGSGGYDDVVLLSIQEDFLGGVRNYLNYSVNRDNISSSEAITVKGPVKLVWGKAFCLPLEVMEELEHVE